jgi:hypothetical protein
MSDFGDESDFDFDVSSILGMSSVLNREETDTGINLKAFEKNLFKESMSSEEYNSGDVVGNNASEDKDEIMEYDPLKEYNDIIAGIDNGMDNREQSKEKINDYTVVNSDEEDCYTEEQGTQNTINSYFSDLNIDSSKDNKTYNFGDSIEQPRPTKNNWDYSNVLEEENRDDMKLRLLEKIDNLKEELEDDGINLDKIPSVDFSSRLEEIENTAKLLMLKATRNRYSNMGEEFILALSNGLEILCNGKREFFGIKPDLTNCTDIVKVKLRRVKNETSQIVADVVEKYEIPPLFTVLIELVPALFLHSQRRSRQKTLCVDLSDDINEIRKYN